MRRAAVLFAALLCPQGGCAFNVALRRAGVASRAPRLATVAAVADGDEAEKPATTTTAQEKRLAAERLALEAERAALEAERVELELAQLKLERGAKEEEKREPASVTTAAPPAPPPAVTPAAPPAVAPAAPPAATPPAPAEEAKPAFGFFNVNMTELPPPPPLTYGSIARLAEGKEPAALQLSDEQIEAAKARVFNLESFYVMKVEQTFLGTIFRGNLRTNSSIA